MIVPEYETARKKAVVLCVDSAFLPYALFLAHQIDQLEGARDFDICILSDTALEIPDSLAHLGIKLFEPVSHAEYHALATSHLPRSAYLRLWAPLVLCSQYDRVLYLDSDMYLDVSGLSQLFDVDLHGRVLAAVRDVQQWYRPIRQVEEFQRAKRSARPYFNSGLLLIDTARYAEAEVLPRALALAANHPDWVRHHDQSLLNLVLDGAWAELSPVWNWQWVWKYPLFTDWVGPRLLHFVAQGKPWADRAGYCPKRFGLAYAAFFARHFPSLLPLPEPRVEVLQTPKRIAWLALRFLVMRKLLLRYLSRFPDAYTTLLPQK